jgi:hypothetical protein
MGNEKLLNVDDYVVTPEGYVYQIKAIDGDFYVLQGVATNRGAAISGKSAVDRRELKLQKVSTAFVNTLKGTP